jgi:F0F1-type ATP synthase assembly protein I
MPEQPSNWGKYVGLGLEMAVGVVLGIVVGQWLDRKYNWAPWGTLGCAMLGISAGMYMLIREGLRMNKD